VAPGIPHFVQRLRARARRALDGIFFRLAERNLADLAIARVLTELEAQGPIRDTAQAVQILSGCLGAQPARIVMRASRAGIDSQAARRFDSTLRTLRAGVPGLTTATSVRFAQLAQELLADRTPVENELYHFDVGRHFAQSASKGPKGRILTALVRGMRAERCLELGTQYGASAFFLLEAQRDTGVLPDLTSVEGFEPMVGISRRILESRFSDGLRLLHGDKRKCLDELAQESRRFDLVFHDAGHIGADYLEDFAALDPLLKSGALLVLDDIRTDYSDRLDDPRVREVSCYDAWRRIAAHSRVERAVELNDTIGIALLA